MTSSCLFLANIEAQERLVEARYEDGISETFTGGADPFTVSMVLFDQDGDNPNSTGLSTLFTTFGQFLDHDIVLSPEDHDAGTLDLIGMRTIEKLEIEWAEGGTLGHAMDAVISTSVVPTFEMVTQNPDASDLVEVAESPEGQVALAKMTGLKYAALARLFAPYSDALAVHGQTPAQLAEFVETNKQAMIDVARDRAHLDALASTLKASVLVLAGQL